MASKVYITVQTLQPWQRSVSFSICSSVKIRRLSLKRLIHDELFDLVDGYGVVNVAAGALALTVVGADASADGREGIFPLDDLKRLKVLAL